MSTSPAAGGIAPGWYQDPGGQLRWWDGSGWTGHVAPPQAPQPVPASAQASPAQSAAPAQVAGPARPTAPTQAPAQHTAYQPVTPQTVPGQPYSPHQPAVQRAPMVFAPPRGRGPLQDRRVLAGIGALVAVAVLGGAAYLTMGGSSTGGTSTTSASAAAQSHRTAVPAGEEHKAAAKVVADAKSALFNAGAVHISVKNQDGSEGELQLQDDDFSEQINGDGFNGTVVRTGSRVFMRGTERFWTSLDSRSSSVAARLAGRWIELDGTVASDFSNITLQKFAADLVDADVVLNPKVEPTTLDGKEAVILSQHNGTQLWVANSGAPVPLKVVNAKDHSTSTLSDFGVRQTIEAPEGAVAASEALKAAPATA